MRRLAATMLALATIAVGQQSSTRPNPAHGDIRAEKDGLVLPAGEFTVGELIEATATYLCRNYLYDFSDVEQAGTFRLQRSIAVDALGAEELLYSLLSTRNFAVLPIDELRSVYGIVLLDASATSGYSKPSPPSPWRSPEEILRRPTLREIAYTHVSLQNADARSVAQMLRQSVSAGRSWAPGQLLAAASDERFLMLHGYRDQVAGAIKLVRHLDRVMKPRDRTLLERIAALERRLTELEKK